MIHTESLSIFQVFVSEVDFVYACWTTDRMERVLIISVLMHIVVLNPGVMITRYYVKALLGHKVIKSHKICLEYGELEVPLEEMVASLNSCLFVRIHCKPYSWSPVLSIFAVSICIHWIQTYWVSGIPWYECKKAKNLLVLQYVVHENKYLKLCCFVSCYQWLFNDWTEFVTSF